MIADTKFCASCNRSIHGRSDKKFCNDFCRNVYHNNANHAGNNGIRSINKKLRMNRRILEKLLSPAKQVARFAKQKLQDQHFDFHYFTHEHTNSRGNRYYFCYEFGYRILKGRMVVVKKNNNKQDPVANHHKASS